MKQSPVLIRSALLRLLAIALLITGIFVVAPLQTALLAPEEIIISGDIAENTTWSGTYRVTYPVSVRAGVRLVIQPGTVIRFEAGTGLDVYGQMLSLGEPSTPVAFTGVVGDWRGLKFLNNDSTYGPSELWGTIVERGGTQGGSVMIDNALVTIANSEIRDGPGDGVIGYARGTAIITNTLITGKPDYALRFYDPSFDPQLAYVRATGNGHNAIGLVGGGSSLHGDRLWENAGLPYDILGTGFTVAVGETLVIEPGVSLRFAESSTLYVAGRLIAAGTPEMPITFTGINPTPGYWSGLNIIGSFANPATAVISYANLEYGGFGPAGGNLRVEAARVLVEYSRIRYSAAYGVHVSSSGLPKISYSVITDNALGGIKNLMTGIQVPALNNWWGHATGPLHPTTNPGGLGSSVSDNVIYQPWLTDPALAGPAAKRPAELQVQVVGRSTYAPGSRQTYAVAYRNGTLSTLNDAVLVVWLPDRAVYRESVKGGMYWPQREQVFWRLGNVLPGEEGIVAVTVEYLWGLPFGTNDSVLAALAGSNAPADLFTLSEYLAYTPPTVVSSQELTQPQIDTLLASNAEAAERVNAALLDSYQLVYAITSLRSDGVSLTEINLLRPIEPLTFQTIFIDAQGLVTARTINRDRYTLETGQTVLRYDHQAYGWQLASPMAAQQTETFAPSITYGQCMKNCSLDIIKSKVAEKAMPVMDYAEKIESCVKAIKDPSNNDAAVLKCGKDVGTKIPGIGTAVDIGADLGVCNSDCQRDPSSHVCTEDKTECNNESWFSWLAGAQIVQYRCNVETGLYFAGETIRYCPPNSKCAVSSSGQTSCQACQSTPASPNVTYASSELNLQSMASTTPEQSGAVASSSSQDISCPACSPAQDPNAKLGIEGLVAPGQTLEYTLQYENVGEGEAFGVFVMDTLSAAFDETSLVIGNGEYLSASRTIFWNVGDLAGKGQPGSKGEFTFTVRLRSDLPAGTVVTNQAAVYFPSVPEVTPTNAVVNIVQPLVGKDQKVETTVNQPVAVTLQGFSAAGGALSFNITRTPSFGTLTGTPPNLIYTPMSAFSGSDHLYFTVSDATGTSLPAQVTFDIGPDPADNIPPQVISSSPLNGGVLVIQRSTALQVTFSEAVDSQSVTASAVTLKRNGVAISIAVVVEPITNRVWVIPTANLSPGSYTLALAPPLADLAANLLAQPYLISFKVEGPMMIFLPLLVR